MPRKKEKIKFTEMVSVIIAHQLKTPIAAIKGFLEALIAGDCGKINSFQKEYLSDSLENLQRISEFVDSLLNISRIEEDQFKMNLKRVSLDKIVEKALSDLFFWIKACNSKVEFQKLQKIPKVLTDSEKINFVVKNLISNAVIYQKGGGKVKITLSKKGKRVIFACKDNGIGIPKKDFEKVFSKFYRSKRAMEINPSGFGLGLFISKSIVEQSGGKIWFSANKKKGMTFYFSLPIAREKL